MTKEYKCNSKSTNYCNEILCPKYEACKPFDAMAEREIYKRIQDRTGYGLEGLVK